MTRIVPKQGRGWRLPRSGCFFFTSFGVLQVSWVRLRCSRPLLVLFLSGARVGRSRFRPALFVLSAVLFCWWSISLSFSFLRRFFFSFPRRFSFFVVSFSRFLVVSLSLSSFLFFVSSFRLFFALFASLYRFSFVEFCDDMNNNNDDMDVDVNIHDDDATETPGAAAVRRAQAAYDLRDHLDEPEEVFAEALDAAENLRDLEAEQERAAFDQQLRNTGNLADRDKALDAIADLDVRRQALLKLEDFQHRERKQKAEDMKQVAMARLIPSARLCGRMRIRGGRCSNPLRRHETICSSCRQSQMRKPSQMSMEEWEAEKQRRRAKREREKEDRLAANDRMVKGRLERKKPKQAAPPAAQFVAPQAVAPVPQVPILHPFAPADPPSAPAHFLVDQQVCHCGEMLQYGHIYTCDKCGEMSCDVAECIRGHKETCPEQ
jgi:hypothetical protein